MPGSRLTLQLISQSLQAEIIALRSLRLDNPVGVEEQSVSGLQRLLGNDGFCLPQPEGQIRFGGKFTYDLALTQQQRQRMTGAGPRDDAGIERQTRDDSRDESIARIFVAESLIDLRVNRGNGACCLRACR